MVWALGWIFLYGYVQGFVNEDFEFWRRFVKDMVEVKLEEYCLWRVSFKDIQVCGTSYVNCLQGHLVS